MCNNATYKMHVFRNTNNIFIERENWTFSDEYYYRLVSYETLAVTVTYNTKRNSLEVHTFIENPSYTTRKHISTFIQIVAEDLCVSHEIFTRMLEATKKQSFLRINLY